MWLAIGLKGGVLSMCGDMLAVSLLILNLNVD